VRGGQLSNRRRHRLLGLSALCAIVGGVATAILLLPTGEKLHREPSGPLSAEQSRPSPRPHQTRLSADERHRLVSSVSLFVSTSVARHHPERSWEIVHPLLREGLTKRQWSTGNIPVVPYPVVGVDLFRLTSVVGRTALVEVVLEPSPKAHLVRKTFLIELRRLPRPPHLWAVSSWVPEGISQTQMESNAPAPAAVVARAYHAHHLSTMWILLPVGALLAALILLPAGVFLRDAYRFRRAEAEFRASLEDPAELTR
jgi:hypothetical protein